MLFTDDVTRAGGRLHHGLLPALEAAPGQGRRPLPQARPLVRGRRRGRGGGASITDADAHRAGEADAGAVRARLGDPPDDAEVYRVAFHRVEPDGPPLAERADLAPDDVAELVERLDRLDRQPAGPWTR